MLEGWAKVITLSASPAVMKVFFQSSKKSISRTNLTLADKNMKLHKIKQRRKWYNEEKSYYFNNKEREKKDLTRVLYKCTYVL